MHEYNDFERRKKLNDKELIRAVRDSISDEFEAIAMYEEIAENIDNKDAKKLFEEVADDEKEHVGNFLRMLKILAPEEAELYEEGAEETDEIIEDKD